jgi:hypothetical protein
MRNNLRSVRTRNPVLPIRTQHNVRHSSPAQRPLLFGSQFALGSGPHIHFYMHQTLFENSAGDHIDNLSINYGLGALLMMEDVKKTGAKEGDGLRFQQNWGRGDDVVEDAHIVRNR